MPLRAAPTLKVQPKPTTQKPRPSVGHSILLVGPPNGGKTFTAAGHLTLPDYLPWKMWNTDRPDGADMLSVPKGCKLVDLTSRLMEDPTILRQELDAELNVVGPLRYRTYILDSISFFHNYSLVVKRITSVGSFQKVGRAGWGDIYIETIEVVLRLRSLQMRGANIIVTCHEAQQDDPTQEKGIDPSLKRTIIVPALSGKSGAQLGANFGMIGYLTTVPSYAPNVAPKHVMYTGSVGNFTARPGVGAIIDPETKKPLIPLEWENPTMDAILQALDRGRELKQQERNET